MSEDCNEWKEAEERLISEYKRLFTGPPEWAFPSKGWDYKAIPLVRPFPPTIPFIGKNYFTQRPRIALYASAENLAHYERKPHTVPDFLCDESAWNRHRAANNEGWEKFFPRCHIGPVENGSLLTAALFIFGRLGIGSIEDPSQFIEKLMVANLGKFSVAGCLAKKPNTNDDYANNKKRVEASLPFFQMDLAILKPDWVLLPKSMLKNKAVQLCFADFLPNSTLMGLPQFNSMVIRFHLAEKNKSKGEFLRKQLNGSQVETWIKKLRGYSPDEPYFYLAEIEKELEIANQNTP